MRTILILASSAIAATTLAAGIASASDLIHVTPPIVREQARITQTIRPASELTVVPQPVTAAPAARRVSAATAAIELADR